MSIPRLSASQAAAALTSLPEWTASADGQAISRSFVFADFAAAFAFMTRVALHAERVDHHPHWCNRWNRVDVTLTTHDAGGLSSRDIAMARAIDGLV